MRGTLLVPGVETAARLIRNRATGAAACAGRCVPTDRLALREHAADWCPQRPASCPRRPPQGASGSGVPEFGIKRLVAVRCGRGSVTGGLLAVGGGVLAVLSRSDPVPLRCEVVGCVGRSVSRGPRTVVFSQCSVARLDLGVDGPLLLTLLRTLPSRRPSGRRA
jgi:hypothetical protein